MTKFLVLNTFKKIRDDRKSYIIFRSGEEYSLDALTVYFNEKDIKCLIETSYIQKQEVPLVENTQDTTQIQDASQDNGDQDNDNAQKQTQNINTQPIQDADATINTSQPQDGNEIDTQDDPQQTLEIMYKTTQPIQDKDGNEIEVGTQFTESELKQVIAQDKRQSKKRIKELLQEEKVMEVKIVK
jgi:hypothetical protein